MEEIVQNSDVGEQIARRYLTFRLDDESYAVNLFSVKEIVAPQKITPIPNAPKFVKGLLNLRGTLIPFIDIRHKFGLEEIPFDAQTAFVIYEVEDRYMGFIVDMVEDVLTKKASQIKEVPDISAEVDTSFIDGLLDADEGVSMILNVPKIFDSKELLDIKQAQELLFQDGEEVKEE